MIDSEFDIQTIFDPIFLVNLFIGLAWCIAALLSLYYMFYGGIALILSGGSDDKIKEAMGTIRYSIIGLVVTFLAFGAIYILGNAADIPISEYINLDNIYNALLLVFDRLLNGPNSASLFG